MIRFTGDETTWSNPFVYESIPQGGTICEFPFETDSDASITSHIEGIAPFSITTVMDTSTTGRAIITATQALSYQDMFTTYNAQAYLEQGNSYCNRIIILKLQQRIIIEPSNIGLVFNKFATWGGKALQFAKAAPTPPGPSFDEVTIGTQTWMAKNLSIDDGGEGIIILDDVSANGVNFGTQGYYTWDAAVRLANSIPGWHLPTKAEWETLFSYIGGTNVSGTKLQSTEGWDWTNVGTDDYGFTVYPVGWIDSEFSTESDYLGKRVQYWTATEINDTDRYIFYFAGDRTVYGQYLAKYYWRSVRLIKDT